MQLLTTSAFEFARHDLVEIRHKLRFVLPFGNIHRRFVRIVDGI